MNLSTEWINGENAERFGLPKIPVIKYIPLHTFSMLWPMPTSINETQDRRGQETLISVFFYCMLDVFRDNSKGKHWLGKLSGL